MVSNRHSRRAFLGQCATGVGAFTVGALASTVANTAPAEKRPNILFALSDNQSWGHCGAMGDPIAKTPGIDRVAQQGVLFEHGYAACPSCTPSRSAILTGQDIWRLEEAGLLWGGFPAKFPTYTDLLRDSGYLVGYTGKGWAPGHWNRHGRTVDPAGSPYNQIRMRNAPRAISRTDYAANFEAFLGDRDSGQPFCFWYGGHEPHRPFPEGLGREQGRRLEDVRLPAFLPDNEVIRNEFLDYYAQVDWFDNHLERMLGLLEKAGELDNTLVVVSSDNGIQMPRGIATFYDYGTRVPLAICWGNRLAANSRSNAFVNLIDLAPTFLDVAGLPVPEQMTGRSLLPLLMEGKDETERNFVVTGIERHTVCRPDNKGYPSRAIRTHDYLYIRNYEPDRWPVGDPDFRAAAQGYYGDVDRGATKSWMLEHAENPEIQSQFALCFGKRPAEELYYTPNDPDQITNLAADPNHATIRQRLATMLETYLKTTSDPRMDGLSPWDEYPYDAIEMLMG